MARGKTHLKLKRRALVGGKARSEKKQPSNKKQRRDNATRQLEENFAAAPPALPESQTAKKKATNEGDKSKWSCDDKFKIYIHEAVEGEFLKEYKSKRWLLQYFTEQFNSDEHPYDEESAQRAIEDAVNNQKILHGCIFQVHGDDTPFYEYKEYGKWNSGP